MNKFIKQFVLEKYGVDVNNCTSSDLEKVDIISVRDCSDDYFGYMSAGIPYPKELTIWDFSDFPNLKELDCSYNTIEELCVSKNNNLESICWKGVRGSLKALDLSSNIKLKKIEGGQDGLIEIDLSANTLLEEVYISLSSDLRWINLDNCINLKRISLGGCQIPFVDLTHCPNLEYVNIHYLNSFTRNCNDYGPGYPRPIVFVNQDFDETVIDEETRDKAYYCYYLVSVSPNSHEEEILNKWKRRKGWFTSIPPIPSEIARVHYSLLKELDPPEPPKAFGGDYRKYSTNIMDPDDLPF